MFKRILIPTDGSPASSKAIKAGVALAKALGASVTGYHGIVPVPYGYYGEPLYLDPRLAAKAERAILAEGALHVAQIEKTARAAGVPFRSAVARPTTTYEGILGTAKKHKCDLIVMASHGRRGIKGVLLGSVTNQVLTHSRIPVLVYR